MLRQDTWVARFRLPKFLLAFISTISRSTLTVRTGQNVIDFCFQKGMPVHSYA
jgi:hypothetical protein